MATSSALQHASQRRLASWATMPPPRYVEEKNCRSAKDLPYVLWKGFTILSHTSVNQPIVQNKQGGVYVSPPRIPKSDLINRVPKTQSFYTWHCSSISCATHVARTLWPARGNGYFLVVYIPTCCYIREPAAFHRGVTGEDVGGTSVGREASNSRPRERGRRFFPPFSALLPKHTCFSYAGSRRMISIYRNSTKSCSTICWSNPRREKHVALCLIMTMKDNGGGLYGRRRKRICHSKTDQQP